MNGANSTTKQVAALVVTCALVVTALSIVPLGAVAQAGGTTTQSPIEINSCTVIDQPGRYVLTTDIENSKADQCIKIFARDVVLDGGGHTIDGVDDFPTGGIVVFGRSGATNVTVTNVIVTDWGAGIAYETTTGEIRDSVVASNSRGITFTYGASATVANTTVRGNDFAGFYVQDSSGSLFVNNVASDNGWAVASRSSRTGGQSDDNPVRNLALDSATVSFESKDIKLGAVESPPTSPTGLTNVGGYVNATSFDDDDGDSFLALSVHYTDAAVANANVNESTLRLYVFSGGAWTKVPGSTVDTETNVVSGTVRSLGDTTVLAPFGLPATESPSDSGDGGRPPAEELANTLTVTAIGDERVYYEFTASGRVESGSRADLTGARHPDEITANTASGSTALGGVDDYTFSGRITSLTLDGGDARVTINGESIDPADFAPNAQTVTTTPALTTTTTTTATATTTTTEPPTGDAPPSTPERSAETKETETAGRPGTSEQTEIQTTERTTTPRPSTKPTTKAPTAEPTTTHSVATESTMEDTTTERIDEMTTDEEATTGASRETAIEKSATETSSGSGSGFGLAVAVGVFVLVAVLSARRLG